ncbi:hypothetical protein HQQ80_11540 [Microbacteriaceae bacterium VKM Ac-2855]|nr:hypothetical protein [Microbacteriaceae bacterium VKM Ac-2855]
MPAITPADLSLELNISQKRVRDILRSIFGTLPPGTTRWVVTDEQADAVRDAVPSRERNGPAEWTLEIGDTVRRRAIHDRYRGQQQGGISTPKSIPDILVFSAPAQGAAFGYDTHEGFREDGSYAYTGEGQIGDMQFVRGNLALRDANLNSRPIRLFTTKGTNATYVGEFTTGDPTCWFETIADVNGNPRRGIIFNLIPVDADVRLFAPVGSPTQSAAQQSTWTPPDASDVIIVQEEPTVPGERVVSRVEFDLQSRFGTWLIQRGTPPTRLRLAVGPTTIEPDFYVEGESWIVEAKRSPARGFVRTAIGQVLDYVNVAERAGILARPVVLLPGFPEDDLVDLMHRLGIGLAVATADGFELLKPASS